MRDGKRPTEAQDFVIKPARLDEFFQDHEGQRHRGLMVAFDKDGNEVAKGTTYAEFIKSLRESEGRLGR